MRLCNNIANSHRRVEGLRLFGRRPPGEEKTAARGECREGERKKLFLFPSFPARPPEPDIIQKFPIGSPFAGERFGSPVLWASEKIFMNANQMGAVKLPTDQHLTLFFCFLISDAMMN